MPWTDLSEGWTNVATSDLAFQSVTTLSTAKGILCGRPRLNPTAFAEPGRGLVKMTDRPRPELEGRPGVPLVLTRRRRLDAQ